MRKRPTSLATLVAITAGALAFATSAPQAAAQQQDGGQFDDRNYAQDQQDQQDQRGEDRDFQQGNRQADDRSQDSQRYDDRQFRQDQQRDRMRQDDGMRDDRMRGNQRSARGQSQDGQAAGLGVSVIEGDRGIRVREVAPNSPAEEAGIERGDEILAINGQRVQRSDELVRRVRQEDPGSEVEIRILRDGQEQTVRANLEPRREALSFERGQQRQQSDRFYRGGGTPPWGSDDIRQHVTALERQVRMMQREIEDLRTMLDNDPSQAGYTQSDSRQNRVEYNPRRSQGDQQWDRNRGQQEQNRQFRDDRGQRNYDDQYRN